MYFPDIRTACEATIILGQQPVAAAELMDRASLASVTGKRHARVPGRTGPEGDRGAGGNQGRDRRNPGGPAGRSGQPSPVWKRSGPSSSPPSPRIFNQLLEDPQGVVPGGGRGPPDRHHGHHRGCGLPIEHLADATLDLQELLLRYQYTEAIIFGHALAGNLHFVFTQDFSTEAEVVRYRDLMDDVVKMVLEKYDGSLKAEHGTGRNMAPFVEKEWGEAAFGLMKAIKNLFDPKGLLNPGVIINSDLEAHVKNLKPLPPTHELVDKCIECGFCEPICPSKHLTFTPRQRIAGRREISRRMVGGRGEAPLKKLVRSYRYQGMNTCAADGLCSTLCPVGIDTGKMIKALREEAHGQLANRVADWTADHFKPVAATAAGVLNTVDRLHKLTGTPFMETVTAAAHTGTAGVVPQWNRAMPTGSGKIRVQAASTADPLAMVYFPSCASRAMGGPAREESERRPLPQQTLSVLEKAGCAVILPDNLGSLCCGQAFESKGFRVQADRKAEELSAALLLASRDGALPILCDTSPCLMRMRNTLDKRLQLFEPVEFVLQFLKDRLQFTRKDARIALHATCSTRKMGLDTRLRELALLCATEVVVPENIFCCGFAGDRGFNFPELNESALHGLADQVHGCEAGYSTSKTCEVGLTSTGTSPTARSSPWWTR